MGDGLYAVQGCRWRHACGLSKDSEMDVQPFASLSLRRVTRDSSGLAGVSRGVAAVT